MSSNIENSRPDSFTDKWYQSFKGERKLRLHKLFHHAEKERTFPNSFHEANATLIPKTDQDIKRKQQTNYLLETQMQNSQQNTSKLNPARHEKDNSHNQVKFIPGMQSKSM